MLIFAITIFPSYVLTNISYAEDSNNNIIPEKETVDQETIKDQPSGSVPIKTEENNTPNLENSETPKDQSLNNLSPQPDEKKTEKEIAPESTLEQTPVDSPAVKEGDDTVTKEEILEIIEDQSPIPVKNIVQEDSNTFVSEQKSLGIEVEIDTEENSVMLGEKGVEVTIGMPNADEEDVEMEVVDGQMVSTSDELDVVVQAIEGGVRQVITIDSQDAATYYDFPVELPSGYYLAQDNVGNVTIRNKNGKILTYVPRPWAKDADGNDIPTHYTIEGTTLRQHIDIGKATTFPIIADPIWCGQAIKSVKWINRGGTHPWSASVVPTTCGAWLGGGFQWGAWQELVDKTPKSSRWDKKYGTSKYWSMYNQYFCHADWAGGFKTPWNLEPTRPNVGYAKTVAAMCNP